MKTADLVSLNLFMNSNVMCNTAHSSLVNKLWLRDSLFLFQITPNELSDPKGPVYINYTKVRHGDTFVVATQHLTYTSYHIYP